MISSLRITYLRPLMLMIQIRFGSLELEELSQKLRLTVQNLDLHSIIWKTHNYGWYAGSYSFPLFSTLCFEYPISLLILDRMRSSILTLILAAHTFCYPANISPGSSDTNLS